jgi:hypothetical protein
VVCRACVRFRSYTDDRRTASRVVPRVSAAATAGRVRGTANNRKAKKSAVDQLAATKPLDTEMTAFGSYRDLLAVVARAVLADEWPNRRS